jgi:hypothetical protein
LTDESKPESEPESTADQVPWARPAAASPVAASPVAVVPGDRPHPPMPPMPAVQSGPTGRPMPPGPPRPPVRLWPEAVWPLDPDAAAPGTVLAGAILTGLVAASVLLIAEPGAAWLLTALPLLTAALATRRNKAKPTKADWTAAGWALAAVALTAIPVVRASGWLFLLSLPAAVLCGLLAITNGQSWTGLTIGTLAGPTALGTTSRWVSQAVRRRDGADRALVVRAILVGAVTLVLLIVFGVLLAGADPLFARLLTAALPDISVFSLVGRAFVFVLVTTVALVAACLAHQRPRFDDLAPPPRAPRPTWEWAVPLGALDALLACFVIMQGVVALDADGYVLSTAGLTYADYARQGFWQLLAVVALTLGVAAAVLRVAGGSEAVHRRRLRVLLGALCVLALLVVLVALRRMWTYEEAYGLTRLRLLVEATEIWLGVVFILVLAAGVRWRAGWLPRAVVGTGVATLLGLAALNPDALIAREAIARFERTGTIDTGYLRGLSPDAVPALQRLPEPERSCVLSGWDERLGNTEKHWTNVNVTRIRARISLGDQPPKNCH